MDHGSDDHAAGIDDYPKKSEVTSLADAQAMLNFAQQQNMNSCQPGRPARRPGATRRRHRGGGV